MFSNVVGITVLVAVQFILDLLEELFEILIESRMKCGNILGQSKLSKISIFNFTDYMI